MIRVTYAVNGRVDWREYDGWYQIQGDVLRIHGAKCETLALFNNRHWLRLEVNPPAISRYEPPELP